MPSTSLPIPGYRGESVPNTFLRAEKPSSRVAVLVPGLGYTCDMPLFYYIERLLEESGIDVLRMNARYSEHPDLRTVSDEERVRCINADVASAVSSALAQGTYEELILIGKSLGTIGISDLLVSPAKPAIPTSVVWLTPLLTFEEQRIRIAQNGTSGLIAIGTADPYFDDDAVASLIDDSGLGAVIIAKGDHSLDIAGDIPGSIDALNEVIEAIGSFLKS